MSGAEQWLPVRGFEGMYEVSDIGRVRSVPRTVNYRRFDASLGHEIAVTKRLRGVLLKPGRKASGHLSVAITKGNSVDVHRLVLEAFVGPCPIGMEGLHADDDGSNNRLDNLRWGTRRDNLHDAVRTGRKATGSRVSWSKLTEADIPEIRAMLASQSTAAIARRFGVNESTIRQVRDERSWKHVQEAA